MRTLLIATLLLGLGACSKGGGSAPGAGLEGEVRQWKERMCKCPDKVCTETTIKEYNAWEKTQRAVFKQRPKDEQERIKGLDRELKACRRAVHAAGGKAPEPDPPEEAGDKAPEPPADRAPVNDKAPEPASDKTPAPPAAK